MGIPCDLGRTPKKVPSPGSGRVGTRGLEAARPGRVSCTLCGRLADPGWESGPKPSGGSSDAAPADRPCPAGRTLEPQRAARGPNAETMRRAAAGEEVGGPGRAPPSFLPAGSASRRRRRRARGLAAWPSAPPRPARGPPPPPARTRPSPRESLGPAAGWPAVPAGSARPPRGSLARAGGGGGASGAAGDRPGPSCAGLRAAPAPAAGPRGLQTASCGGSCGAARARRFPLSAARVRCGRGAGGGVRAAGRSPRGG